MAILLLGGTGKTATRVAHLLTQASKPFLVASRRGPDAVTDASWPAVKFDWTDEASWGAAFSSLSIDAVYMMEPQVPQPWVPMINFVGYAKARGVRRFVLCAGTSAVYGRDGMGRVWKHYVDEGVEWCVLRPSWFMENLVEPGLVYTITQLGKIFTACQDGVIPFVSADDIASVAFHALTDAKSHDTDIRILGPENLTYDDIAAKLSKTLGRTIEHVKQVEEGRYQGLMQAGVSDYYARFITNLEVKAAGGLEEGSNDAVLKVTGRPPKSFDTFAEENKAVWSQ